MFTKNGNNWYNIHTQGLNSKSKTFTLFQIQNQINFTIPTPTASLPCTTNPVASTTTMCACHLYWSRPSNILRSFISSAIPPPPVKHPATFQLYQHLRCQVSFLSSDTDTNNADSTHFWVLVGILFCLWWSLMLVVKTFRFELVYNVVVTIVWVGGKIFEI